MASFVGYMCYHLIYNTKCNYMCNKLLNKEVFTLANETKLRPVKNSFQFFKPEIMVLFKIIKIIIYLCNLSHFSPGNFTKMTSRKKGN